jgi:hypothetical protein
LPSFLYTTTIRSPVLERDAAIHDESRANHIIINILILIIIILSISIIINIININISPRSAPSVIFIINALLVNLAPYFTAHIITDTA